MIECPLNITCFDYCYWWEDGCRYEEMINEMTPEDKIALLKSIDESSIEWGLL